MAQIKELSNFVLPIVLLMLFTQCKNINEPLGYYYMVDDDIRPSFCFYYNDRVHASLDFYRTYGETSFDIADSLVKIFNQKKNVYTFYDNGYSIDTLSLTICNPSYWSPFFHFLITPSTNRIDVYQPEDFKGTYEIKLNEEERGLISHAVSQIILDDVKPEYVSFERQPNNLIIEDSYCSIMLRADGKYIDSFINIFADDVPQTLFFLIDVLGAIANDYCKASNRISDTPCATVLSEFEKKLQLYN